MLPVRPSALSMTIRDIRVANGPKCSFFDNIGLILCGTTFAITLNFRRIVSVAINTQGNLIIDSDPEPDLRNYLAYTFWLLPFIWITHTMERLYIGFWLQAHLWTFSGWRFLSQCSSNFINVSHWTLWNN